jgi:poly-gamma-glutamate synthesis protein (capsule biosynthesis protein)
MRTSRWARAASVILGGLLLGSFVFGAVDIGTAESGESMGVETTTTTTFETSTSLTAAIEPDAPATTSTTEAAPTEPEKRDLVVHAVGDVALDPDYIVDFRSQGYAYAFAELDGLFDVDDLTVINLECAPSHLGTPLDKTFVFRCPPPALAVAHSNGVDVVNLANNHSQDYGTTAMLDGVLQSRLAGLEPVGVGADLTGATRPAVVEAGGWKIAVIGMGGVVPGESWLATDERPGMASGDDIDQMTDAVRAAGEIADLVFVTIHWGIEGESAPRADDRARAVEMIEAGADAIFGHHPHRLGELEIVDGVPVYWTLGNFIWPRLSDASATSGVARLEIGPNGTIEACLLPAFIERSGQPSLIGPRTCEDAS